MSDTQNLFSPQTAASPPPNPTGQQRWSVAGLEGLLSGYFAQLEQKIADNQEEARKDQIWFWSLKGGVLLGTLGAGVLESYGHGALVPALGLVASAVAAVDAIWPKGIIYRERRTTVAELTLLLERVRTEWEVAKLKFNPALGGADLRNATVSILERIAAKTDVLGHSAASAEAVIQEPKSAHSSPQAA